MPPVAREVLSFRHAQPPISGNFLEELTAQKSTASVIRLAVQLFAEGHR